jgi:hypothetical protein
MRDNIIQQQNGGATKPARLHACMRQNHPDQQRLLLAGRCQMRRRASGLCEQLSDHWYAGPAT